MSRATDILWLEYLRDPTPAKMRVYSTACDREERAAEARRAGNPTFKERWNEAYEAAIGRGYCDTEAAKHANLVAGAAIRTFEDECDDAKVALREQSLAL